MYLQKLSDKQRNDIKDSHKKGESIGSISRRYAGLVSKWSVSYFLNPERGSYHRKYVRLAWRRKHKVKKHYKIKK